MMHDSSRLFGYSHISKTGGTTLLTILRSTFGVRHCDIEPWKSKHQSVPFGAEDLRKVRKTNPFLKSVSGHHFKPYHDYEHECSIRYYVFLRDPVSRVLSEYQYQTTQHGKTWDLEKYIESSANLQTRFICGEADANSAIEIIHKKDIFCGLTEKFDESLLLLNKQVFNGMLDIHYNRQKTAPDQSLRKKIEQDPSNIVKIRQANAQDSLLYDYVRAKVYQDQVTAYGQELSTDLTNFKLALQEKGFNQKKIFFNRAYRNAVYKPALYLYRSLYA